MSRSPVSTAIFAMACLVMAVSPGPVLGLPSGTDAGPTGSGYPAAGALYMKPSEYRKALKLIGKDKYREAIPLLLKALEKSPQDADILNELGYAYRQTGDYTNGLKYYQDALKIDPDHQQAREYLGELYLKQHDLPNAQAQLTELVRLCPDGCEAREDLEKAIAAYKK